MSRLIGALSDMRAFALDLITGIPYLFRQLRAERRKGRKAFEE
jgi:hypothetical protein